MKEFGLRSLWGSGGAGGGGGGQMFRVRRGVRTGVGGADQEPFSRSTLTTGNTNWSPNSGHSNKPTISDVLSLSSSTISSSPFSPSNLPICATSTLTNWFNGSSPDCENFDSEYVDGSEFERAHAFWDECVFGSVPSKNEVHRALSALQQVLDPASYSQFIKDRLSFGSDKDAPDESDSLVTPVKRVSSVGSELDWIEPPLQLSRTRILPPYGSDIVCDAFHLLQTQPCIQRMVISLSSDEAVWDAVLNNEVVRELRETLNEDGQSVPGNPDDNAKENQNAAMKILSWIFENTKVKVMDLIEKIAKLVNELFQPPQDERTTGDSDPFQENLRASFLLSIVVLLVVVVTRAYGAQSS